MKFRKILVPLILCLTLVLLMPTAANALTEDGYTYTVHNGEAFLARCEDNIGNVTLPSSLGGYPVTQIGPNLFCTNAGKDVTGVIIPDSVIAIAEYAFAGCKDLIRVSIPDSVKTLNKYAFQDCVGLAAAVLPAGIDTVSEGTFMNCSTLNRVVIPVGVTAIEKLAFSGCNQLTNVYYGGTQEQWNAITVGAGNEKLTNATVHCEMTGGLCGENRIWTLDKEGTLTITSTGPTVEAWYFPLPWNAKRSSIKKAVVEERVMYVGEDAFKDCENLTSVILPADLSGIGYGAFSNCTSLPSVTLPDGMIDLGSFAFRNCTSLTEVTIPGSVYEILNGAFSGCRNITNVVLGNGLSRIHRAVFSGCSSLKTITIPDSVAIIEETAFSGCDSLTDVYYNGTRTQWEEIDINEDGNESLLNARLHCLKQRTGDLNGDGEVTTNDAVYLLLFVMFGAEDYPIPAGTNLDFDGSGAVDTNDAVYLLLHVMFGAEDYPLSV